MNNIINLVSLIADKIIVPVAISVVTWALTNFLKKNGPYFFKGTKDIQKDIFVECAPQWRSFGNAVSHYMCWVGYIAIAVIAVCCDILIIAAYLTNFLLGYCICIAITLVYLTVGFLCSKINENNMLTVLVFSSIAGEWVTTQSIRAASNPKMVGIIYLLILIFCIICFTAVATSKTTHCRKIGMVAKAVLTVVLSKFVATLVLTIALGKSSTVLTIFGTLLVFLIIAVPYTIRRGKAQQNQEDFANKLL